MVDDLTSRLEAHIAAVKLVSRYIPENCAASDALGMALSSAEALRSIEAPPSAMGDTQPVAWPKVYGVSRMFDNEKVLLVTFAIKPTDDELRAVDDRLKGRAAPQSAPPEEGTTIEDALKVGYNSGIRAAHNVCVLISDKANRNDESERAQIAGECADAIKIYHDPDSLDLAEMKTILESGLDMNREPQS